MKQPSAQGGTYADSSSVRFDFDQLFSAPTAGYVMRGRSRRLRGKYIITCFFIERKEVQKENGPGIL